jgi:FADH2 O2-dependent halogenase
MLRFDNGITSVGLTTGTKGRRLDLRRYPSLDEIFCGVSQVAPHGGPVVTDRLQRLFDPIVGDRCLMLPTAAVTIDPLHSTGIAHALAGVERVAEIVLGADDARQQRIAEYRESILEEATWLDRLVATAYRAMDDFPRFVAACTLYFAAAIRCEERYGAGDTPARLWNADDADFASMVASSCDGLCGCEPSQRIIDELRVALRPWNFAGLLDPLARHRYAYTATKTC